MALSEKEKSKRWRERHPEKKAERAAYVAQWRLRNPDKLTAYSEKQKKDRILESALDSPTVHWDTQKKFKKYNLDKDQLRELLDAHNGKCYLCGKEIAGKSRHIDHDHETGKVRKILCSSCNTGLGLFHDNVELLKRRFFILICTEL